MRWTPLALCGLFALTACGSDDLVLEGEYTSSGVWDLSEPLGPDGIGGAFSDVLIEEATAAAVPGILEDEAIDVVRALARDRLADAVDARLPLDLRRDGVVLAQLRGALARVEVDSELVFTDDVEGAESITRMRFDPDGVDVVLDAASLPRGVTARAEIDGDREARDRVELDPYTLELHYGALVLVLVDELFEEDVLGRASAAIPCAPVVDAITDDDGRLGFEVAGRTFGISRDDLASACAAAKQLVLSRALSAASVDTGVELRGRVTLLDEDGDGLADLLTTDQEFEGRFTKLPRPLELRFAPTFVATRR